MEMRPTHCGCPVKASVRRLYRGGVRLAAVGPVMEAVQGNRAARGREAEERAITTGATRGGCPVQTAVGSLHEPGQRPCPVSRVETVQGSQHAVSGDLEDSAESVSAALVGC